MKTHLTSTQAELDQMKAELEAAVKRDQEVLGWAFEYMADNQVSKVLAVGAEMPEALCAKETGTYGPLSIEGYKFKPQRDPNTEAWQAFSRAHDYLTPCPKVVWEAAWLAAEASFQEKHKYQLVCCPKCDHEFEYEPDLT